MTTSVPHWLRYLLLLTLGCTTIGDNAPFPDPVQTSGVGPFRRLDVLESGVAGRPEGRALLMTGATTGGMFVPGFFFYVEAQTLSETPERDAALLPDVVDWQQFEPRRIFRAASRPEDLGHQTGDEVLAATEAWEGDAVFDPCVVLLEDGRARIYYAAQDGIGVAEASSPGAAFTRVAGPIVAGRSPTVVADPAGGWLMYFESATGIGLARSSDGVAFSVETEALALDVTPTDPDLPTEVAFRRPGAVTVTTPVGRTNVRLYFEVLFSDDTRAITIAVSEVGDIFERLERPVYSDDNAGAPMPFVDDQGRTRLYLTVEHELRGTDIEARAVVMTVAPGFERYVEIPEPDTE